MSFAAFYILFSITSDLLFKVSRTKLFVSRLCKKIEKQNLETKFLIPLHLFAYCLQLMLSSKVKIIFKKASKDNKITNAFKSKTCNNQLE